MKRIALVGDYDENKVAHRAIPIALKLAFADLGADATFEWLPSRELPPRGEARLEPYAALWCVPGSPYENTHGVIEAIRLARLQRRPFLGTCGGFQHALLEYAQAVWGIDATHAETNPEAEDPVIAPLMCSLVDVRGGLKLEPGSRLRAIYGRESANEEYHCNYGLNPRYANRLQSGPLKIAARVFTAIGDPAAEIVAFANKQRCTGIVMGNRGQHPVAGLLLGSVATKVVHLAKCPVTIVK